MARRPSPAAPHPRVGGWGSTPSLPNESKLALPPRACRSIVFRIPRIKTGVKVTELLNCVTPLLSKTFTDAVLVEQVGPAVHAAPRHPPVVTFSKPTTAEVGSMKSSLTSIG